MDANYRPVNIEFQVANSNSEIVPDFLGKFETLNAAAEFIATNLVGINSRITVNRFMDQYEKSQLRTEYQELLEDKMPIVERDFMRAKADYDAAKVKLSEAQEFLGSVITEAKKLATQVKRGVVEISLDDIATWRVPYDNRYYYYTYIDGILKLAKIADIPDYEKNDLFNSMTKNDQFFTHKDETAGPAGE